MYVHLVLQILQYQVAISECIDYNCLLISLPISLFSNPSIIEHYYFYYQKQRYSAHTCTHTHILNTLSGLTLSE